MEGRGCFVPFFQDEPAFYREPRCIGYDVLVFNTGNDSDCPSAATADLNVDADGRPLEGHLCGAIAVRCLQGLDHLPGGTQCKAGNGYGWAGNIPAETFTLTFLVPLAAHSRV